MTLTDAEIAVRLSRIRDELDDPKWGTWRYMEGGRVYDDLANMVRDLDILIGVLDNRAAGLE